MMIVSAMVVMMAQVGQEPIARLHGDVAIPSVSAAVTITYDDRLIPTVEAPSYADALLAQGYLHAQHRYFQMDMMRRLASGQLAEVIGSRGVSRDRSARKQRPTHLARQVLAAMDETARHRLTMYVAGVNAGLEDLTAPPFEYSMLSTEPEPWTAVDTVMVTLAMADMLDNSMSEELRYASAAEVASKEAMEFGILVPDPLNAPLLGTPVDPPPFPQPAISPVASVRGSTSPVETSLPAGIGSNNWAIGPSRSADGRAILASDPHLMYALPGTWYRVLLTWPEHMVVGISVPGIPGVVMGSNGSVAWGFTNTTGDFADMIVIERDPDDPQRYLVPGGSEPFEHVAETIVVRGDDPVDLEMLVTRWGVVGHGGDGEPEMVEHWTLLQPGEGMFAILDLPFAKGVDAALDIGARWHGPSQNMVVVDESGSIGWTVTGLIPNREGFSGRVPVSWADGTNRWAGFVELDRRPRVVDPPAGGVWTANNRTVEGEDRDLLGWSFAAGARAGRIASVVQETTGATEADMLALQLDTRLEVFDFYRDLMLARLHEMEQTPRRLQAIEVLKAWNGTADADQVAVRMLESFRSGLKTVIRDEVLLPPGAGLYAGLGMPLSEGALRRFVTEQPDDLVPRNFATWNHAIDGEVDRAVERKLMEETDHLTIPWGDRNMAMFEHPMAQMMPFGADALRLPEVAQSGHPWAVRVATPRFGASARLVVSPGHEDQGILHLPGGQSGHPMSPHFSSGHDDWLYGRPSPLLPGAEVARVRLVQ